MSNSFSKAEDQVDVIEMLVENAFNKYARNSTLLVMQVATVASYNQMTQKATVYFPTDTTTPSNLYRNLSGVSLSIGDKVYVFHKFGDIEQGWIMVSSIYETSEFNPDDFYSYTAEGLVSLKPEFKQALIDGVEYSTPDGVWQPNEPLPDVTTRATSLFEMFSEMNVNMTTLDLSQWDTSNVINMERVFSGFDGVTNLILDNWNTINVTNMESMFNWYKTSISTIQDIDISHFDVSSVVNMSNMLRGRNLPNLNTRAWNTSNVKLMNGLFYNCRVLPNDLNLNHFNMNNVLDISGMFGCDAGYGFTNITSVYPKTIDISQWISPQIDDLSNLFSGRKELVSISFPDWSSIQPKFADRMFAQCSSLTDIDLSTINMSQVLSTVEMFFNCSSITNVDMTPFSPYAIDTMYGMFQYCENLTEIIAPTNQTTAGVDNFDRMFDGCSSLTSLDLSWISCDFYDNNITAQRMFSGCTSLIDFMPPSGFVVDDASQMFSNCNSLTRTDFTFIKSIASIENLFLNCSSLTEINLSHATTGSSVILSDNAFQGCINVTNSLAYGLPEADLLNNSLNKPNNVNFTGVYSNYFYAISPTNTELQLQEIADPLTYNNFKNSIWLNKDYTYNGETLWVAGTPLPNILPSATSLRETFYNTYTGMNLDLTQWDVSNITNVSSMCAGDFQDTTSLNSINMNNWNTSNFTNIRAMFVYCSQLTSATFEGWNTSSVEDMSSMFGACSSLTYLDLSSFTVENLSPTGLIDMFTGCTSLTYLDLSGMDLTNIDLNYFVFKDCTSLTTAYARTQADADKFNATTDKPDNVIFTVKP